MKGVTSRILAGFQFRTRRSCGTPWTMPAADEPAVLLELLSTYRVRMKPIGLLTAEARQPPHTASLVSEGSVSHIRISSPIDEACILRITLPR